MGYLFCKIIFLLTVMSANAQNVSPITGSRVLQHDARQALDFHNKVRKDVSNFPLTWDAELAKYAQEWADYLAKQNSCNIKHRAFDPSKNIGENIFWGSGREYTVLEASQAWYSEINEYSYGIVSEKNYQKTGHYTQMVWKDTKKMGIGISTCSDGTIIIVANYFPAGNYIGQKPY